MDCSNFTKNARTLENDRQQDDSSSNTSQQQNTEEDSNSDSGGIDHDAIESKLKGLGVNRRNVRTMICAIFKEPQVKELLESNPEDGGQDIKLVSRNLRSFSKKAEDDKFNIPSFVDITLPDEDTNDSEYDVTDDLVEAKKMKLDMLVPSGDEETTPDTTPNINERYDKEEAATLITRMTRSKHQVDEKEQAQIAAFQANPPDKEEDDSVGTDGDEESNGDSEFKKFVFDAWGTNQKEEDSDGDPDYNFLAATESNNDDSSYDVYRPKLQISKKEVKELIKQSFVTVDHNGLLVNNKDSKLATSSDPRATITTVTVKEKLSKMRETKGGKRRNRSGENPISQHSNERKLTEEACPSVPSESNTREGMMCDLFGDVGNSIMDTSDFVQNFDNKQASTAAQPLMHNEVSSSSFSSAEDPKRTAAVFESNNTNSKKENRKKNSTTQQPPFEPDPTWSSSSVGIRPARKVRAVTSSPSSSSDNTTAQPERILSKRESKPSRRMIEINNTAEADQTASAPRESKKRGVKRTAKGKQAAVETEAESSGNLKVVIRPKRSRRMHCLHPALGGKELNDGDSRSCARNLQRMADSIRPLEENTMIQDDPTKCIKDKIFAAGYMDRVKDELDPKNLAKFLRILTNFRGDNRQAPAELVRKLRVLFVNHPHLSSGFAPFILPQQAAQCGLLSEHLVYHRVRTFLRNVEFRYQNNQVVLDKILSVFTRIAKETEYSYKLLKRSVLEELKGELDLQDEFRMVFDDERPPVSRLHDESEMTQGDVSSDRSYELLHVNKKKVVEAADTSVHFQNKTTRKRKKMVIDDVIPEEKGQKKDAPRTELGSKTLNQTSSGKDRKRSNEKAEEYPPDNKVVTSSEITDVIKKNNEKLEERLPSAFQPYTSQKHAEETESKETVPKDTTPVKVVEKQPKPEEEKKEAEVKDDPWTPNEDTQLLVTCKKFPSNIQQAFEDFSKTTSRSIPHIKQRFRELMSFLAKKNKKEESSESDDDDDDSSDDDDDESDSDSGSDE